MDDQIKILDVVALIQDIPQAKLVKGQVGTVVEELGRGAYEVEFCDDEGRTYATASIPGDQLIVLHYSPVAA
jgi:hypothetical protein